MADASTPYHDRDGYIWMDGEFVPWRETTIHVLTHGLHYASSVFEGERAYGGHILPDGCVWRPYFEYCRLSWVYK